MSIYEDLGVDRDKSTVREIFRAALDNEFPNLFVNVVRDLEVPGRVITSHSDGGGSKGLQRLLHYFENHDPSVLLGAVDDALSMNTSDIAAAGFVFGQLIVTNVLNIGLGTDTKEVVMRAIASRFIELKALYREHGFNMRILGGETADLKDNTRNMLFDVNIVGFASIMDLVRGNVVPGDCIFGFASDGRAIWETDDNSGIMSNGLTLARCALMHGDYNWMYPQLRRKEEFFRGRFHYDDIHPDLGGQTVGNAIISPTRQWPLLIKKIITNLKKVGAGYMLHGISINTGSGGTKIRHVGAGGIRYEKTMPTPPPLFKLIQDESGEAWKDMFKGLNMGVGIDVVGQDSPIFRQALQKAASGASINLYELGRATKAKSAGNEVVLETPYGTWEY